MAARAREAGAELRRVTGASVEEDVPLSAFTSWRTGGPARYLITVSTPGSLTDSVKALDDVGVPLLVLGNGSNVLVADSGFSGAVMRLKDQMATVEVDGQAIVAGAGALLGAAVSKALRASLSGLEFAVGIPGTVGGAVMTNAGTFAGRTAASLVSVEAVDRNGGTLTVEEFDDVYRTALVADDLIVAAARFDLHPEDSASMRSRMDEVRSRREGSQPLGTATAGSVFKNPPGEAAGRLLDQCGLKGASVGGAAVSDVHANFIINNGTATSADIKALIDLMAREVDDAFGVRLEPEVRLVGFKES